MQVDIRVPVGLPIPEVADFIARCEDAGFDGVGVHDHPHSGRDVYVTLALAAQRTRRLRLYPATSSPVVRHPLVLASLAHSLDEIAPGRICLTVAPGFLAVRSIGQPRASLATMREAVLDLRRLLAGESVAFGSTPSRLRNLSDRRGAPGRALPVGVPHHLHRADRAGGKPRGRPALAPAVVRAGAPVADLPQRVQPLLAAAGRPPAAGRAGARGDLRRPGRPHLRRARTLRAAGALP